MRARSLAMVLIAACVALWGCDKRENETSNALTVLTCNEAAFLEPHLRRLAQKEGFALHLRYLAAQELVQELAKPEPSADAVIAPSGEWLALAEGKGRAALGKPVGVMTLPVALGVRQSLAAGLGLDASGVEADRLCALAGGGQLGFLLSAPSQSGVGLAVYLGMARALSAGEDPLAPGPEVRERLKAFFSGVSRSAGSHLWVKNLFESGAYPAMFNYAHVLAQCAQEAARDGAEPLVVVPVKGADMACAPVFAPVEKPRAPKALCELVAAYLTSPDMQAQLAAQDREAPQQTQGRVSGPALAALLTLYQEELRKPAFTVLAVELSASMKGYAERELKRAARQALDPALLAGHFLQPSPRDQTYLMVFNDKVARSWRLDNVSRDQQNQILQQFEALVPQGGANPYAAVGEAGALAAKAGCQGCLAQVILVAYANPTAQGKTLAQVKQQWQVLRQEVPVQGVLFGEMAPVRMDEIVLVTRGRIFDGRTDLSRAVLAARAYND